MFATCSSVLLNARPLFEPSRASTVAATTKSGVSNPVRGSNLGHTAIRARDHYARKIAVRSILGQFVSLARGTAPSPTRLGVNSVSFGTDMLANAVQHCRNAEPCRLAPSFRMDMTRMNSLLIAVKVALVLAIGCGAVGPPSRTGGEAATADDSSAASRARFAGAWSLARIERRDADGELLAPPIEDRLGYIIYDSTGYMGVTIMRPGRQPYSERGPTAKEALALVGTYTSYFGAFSVNEEEGFVVHHLKGSLNPQGAGSDYKRFYAFGDNTLTLQPPARNDGSRMFLVWERLPDLPQSLLTDTHKKLFGVYQIESVTRQTTDGKSVPVDQYEEAYILYAPSGHMSVHLMRPGRTRYAGEEPTGEEALMATRTYASYFGPFSVHEDEQYVVHHRVGSENPAGTGVDAQRFFVLSDTHLTLRPPPLTDNEGRRVETALRWARISK